MDRKRPCGGASGKQALPQRFHPLWNERSEWKGCSGEKASRAKLARPKAGWLAFFRHKSSRATPSTPRSPRRTPGSSSRQAMTRPACRTLDPDFRRGEPGKVGGELVKLYSVPGLDPGSRAAGPHRPRCREAPSTKTRRSHALAPCAFRSPSPPPDGGGRNRHSKNNPTFSPARGRGTPASAVVESDVRAARQRAVERASRPIPPRPALPPSPAPR